MACSVLSETGFMTNETTLYQNLDISNSQKKGKKLVDSPFVLT